MTKKKAKAPDVDDVDAQDEDELTAHLQSAQASLIAAKDVAPEMAVKAVEKALYIVGRLIAEAS